MRLELIETATPEVLDEVAYVALVGLLGVVPKHKTAGAFRTGQLSLSYEWRKPAGSNPQTILANDFFELVVPNSDLILEGTNRSIEALLRLWAFVQDRSDTKAYWPSDQRRRWIQETARDFQTTDDFVQNLVSSYPQIRRLFS
jgi:hypothetical protein